MADPITITTTILAAGKTLLDIFSSHKGSNVDTEYINDVNAEKQREYTAAQAALNKVNPQDTQTINSITNLFNAEMQKWGDPNNPNRNVADPAGFKTAMAELERDYKDPFAAAVSATNTATQDNFSIAFTPDGSPAIFNKLTGLLTPLTGKETQIVTQTAPLTTTGVDTYMPLIIAGLGVIALIFILKKRR